MTSKVNSNVVDMTHYQEDEHLEQEHGLIKTTAYVISQSKNKGEREGAAKRMAEMRARKKAAGLVTCELPAEMAEGIKSAGGPEAWLESIQAKLEPLVVEVEKIIEVVTIDTVRLDKARFEIAELKKELDRQRQYLEEIYDMSLMDRIFGRWP